MRLIPRAASRTLAQYGAAHGRRRGAREAVFLGGIGWAWMRGGVGAPPKPVSPKWLAPARKQAQARISANHGGARRKQEARGRHGRCTSGSPQHKIGVAADGRRACHEHQPWCHGNAQQEKDGLMHAGSTAGNACAHPGRNRPTWLAESLQRLMYSSTNEMRVQFLIRFIDSIDLEAEH